MESNTNRIPYRSELIFLDITHSVERCARECIAKSLYINYSNGRSLQAPAS